MSFSFLDHTADIKIRIEAASIEKAFDEAAQALGSYLSSNARSKATKTIKIDIDGEDREALLYEFIDQIIYLAEQKKFIATGATVKFSTDNVKGTLTGHIADTIKQLKAATYSEMKIERKKSKIIVEFVVDV